MIVVVVKVDTLLETDKNALAGPLLMDSIPISHCNVTVIGSERR